MYLLHGPFVRGFACHDIHVRGGQNMESEDQFNSTNVLRPWNMMQFQLKYDSTTHIHVNWTAYMTSICVREDNDENYVLRVSEEEDRRETLWLNRQEATEW
jgi:hypothetical protein